MRTVPAERLIPCTRSWLLAWWLCALLIWTLSGCGSLPRDVPRPVSNALPPTEQTALGQWVRARHATDQARHSSAFVLLAGAPAAYGSRLALIDAAEKTLDLQYYAIHADASSERLLRGLAAAAKRGVRVRILLDDYHSVGSNSQVLRLAYLPNIEMRLFNPLSGPRNWAIGRALNALTDFHRAQQRMHNKLFLADNTIGIAGGRNLGDAYFDQHDSSNFIDLDVMAAGAIVRDLSRSFDSYWNNERAYPVSSLVSRTEIERMASPAASGQVQPDSTDDSASPSAQRFSAIWDQTPMDLQQAPWVWASATVLADRPTKIALEGEGAEPSTSAQPPALRPGAGMMEVLPRAGRAAAALQADSVVDGLLALIRRAREDLFVVSPYFVPGEDMKQAFAQARQRGVRVRVLTNSLASNDAPLAHAGYARHRKELLALGVQLYEMRSERAGLRNSLSASSAAGASRAMLHSKLLVIDGALVAVGSMNLDLRSQLHNTEIALLIASRALGRQAMENIEAGLAASAWQVMLTDSGQLVWRAPQGSGLEDAHTEPDASLPLRLMLQLLGPFAPDNLL